MTNLMDKVTAAKMRWELLKNIGSPEEIDNARRALLAEIKAVAPRRYMLF